MGALSWVAGHHLKLSSLPQILQVGGRAASMARRVSSQETMWRRSEPGAWDCVRHLLAPLPAREPGCASGSLDYFGCIGQKLQSRDLRPSPDCGSGESLLQQTLLGPGRPPGTPAAQVCISSCVKQG